MGSTGTEAEITRAQKRMQKINVDVIEEVSARNGTCESRLSSHKLKMTGKTEGDGDL